MSKLLVKNNKESNGRKIHVTPESANWKYVGFDLYSLAANAKASDQVEQRETLLVIILGKIKIQVGDKDFGELGQRLNVFEWTAPFSVYVPANTPWQAEATTDNAELAMCTAPGGTDRKTLLIAPEDIEPVTRGKGANTRHIHPIMMEEREGADSLLVTEVLTPQGNWSSYPSHKHDTDDFPNETLLEETYLHHLNPPQGFGVHRIYTDERDLDETVSFSDGDVTLVPRGYHPVGAPYGYDLYYLNVMAGPRRNWRFTNDPDHDWIFQRDK